MFADHRSGPGLRQEDTGGRPWTVKPLVGFVVARANELRPTHSILVAGLVDKREAAGSSPEIWPSSTRARAAMLGRLMPNVPATVRRFVSRAMTSVQMPPFGLIPSGA